SFKPKAIIFSIVIGSEGIGHFKVRPIAFINIHDYRISGGATKLIRTYDIESSGDIGCCNRIGYVGPVEWRSRYPGINFGAGGLQLSRRQFAADVVRLAGRHHWDWIYGNMY